MRMTPKLLVTFINVERPADDPDGCWRAWRATCPRPGDVLLHTHPDGYAFQVQRVRLDTDLGDGIARATVRVVFLRGDVSPYHRPVPW